MGPITEVCRAYDEGYRALLLSGRSLYDLIVVDDNKMRPLIEAMRRELKDRYGMVLVTYSMAGGLDWDAGRIEDERDRKTIEKALQTHRLLNIPKDQNEIAQIISGISSLVRAASNELKWSDGKSLRFAIMIEFAEHRAPKLLNGTQTDPQLLVIELSHLTAQSLALRTSGNMVIFHGRDGLIDELVSGPLHHIRLRQPDREEKKAFLTTAMSLYKDVSLEDGLDIEAIARLTTNTPNRGLEQLLRASHLSGKGIAYNRLTEQKRRDVEALSEGTLTSLETSRVDGINLCGVNVETPKRMLMHYAAALMKGDSSMPANVLLVGPPGTGKTDLAILTAHQANVPAYAMHSPKGGIVGETERKARLQQTVLGEGIPNVALVDEITEALPLERSDFDGDSGASRAVMAELLKSFSDEGRRGKSLLIATTNCPWRMGAAMRSRFTFIPVLYPLKEDFAEIVLAIARKINPGAANSTNDSQVKEGASIFHDKGATPRHIRQALSNALLLHGSLTPDSILFAAHDLCASSDLYSGIYTDLWAIKVCSSRSFLPWNSNPTRYLFPSHFHGIVNPENGEINYQELDKRIEELKSYAKV